MIDFFVFGIFSKIGLNIGISFVLAIINILFVYFLVKQEKINLKTLLLISIVICFLFIISFFIEIIFCNGSFVNKYINFNFTNILDKLKYSKNINFINLYTTINTLSSEKEKLKILYILISSRPLIILHINIYLIFHILTLISLLLINNNNDTLIDYSNWFFNNIFLDNNRYKKSSGSTIIKVIAAVLLFVILLILIIFYSYLYKYKDCLASYAIYNNFFQGVDIQTFLNNITKVLLANKIYYFNESLFLGIPFAFFCIAFLISFIEIKSKLQKNLELEFEVTQENRNNSKDDNLRKIIEFLTSVKAKFQDSFEVIDEIRWAYDEDSKIKSSERFSRILENRVDLDENISNKIEYLEKMLESIGLKDIYDFQNDYLKNLIQRKNSIILQGNYGGAKTIIVVAIMYKVFIENKCVLVVVKHKDDSKILQDIINRFFSCFFWLSANYIKEAFEEDKFENMHFSYPTIIFSSPEMINYLLEFSSRIDLESTKSYFFQNLDMIYFDDLHKFETVELLGLGYLLQRLNQILKKEGNEKEPFITATLIPYKNLEEFIEKRLSIFSGSKILNVYRKNRYSSNHLYSVFKLYELKNKNREIKKIPSEVIKNAFLKGIYPIMLVGFSEFYNENDYKDLINQVREEVYRSNKNYPEVENNIIWFTEYVNLNKIYKEIKLVICSGEIKTLYKSFHYFSNIGYENYLLNVIIFCKDPLEEFYLKYFLKFWDLKEYNSKEIYSFIDYAKYLPNRIISGEEIQDIIYKKNILLLLNEGSYSIEEISNIFSLSYDKVKDIINEFNKYLQYENNRYKLNIEDRDYNEIFKEIDNILLSFDRNVHYRIIDINQRLIGFYPVRYVKTIIKPVYINKILRNQFYFKFNNEKYIVNFIDENSKEIKLGRPIQYGYNIQYELTKEISLDTQKYEKSQHNFTTVDNYGKILIKREFFDNLEYKIEFKGMITYNFNLLLKQIQETEDREKCITESINSKSLVIEIEDKEIKGFEYINHKTIKLFANLIKQMAKMIIEEPLTNIEAIYKKLKKNHYIFIFDYSNPDSTSIKEIDKALFDIEENIITKSIINFINYVNSLNSEEKLKNVIDMMNDLYIYQYNSEDEKFNLEDYLNLKKFLIEDFNINEEQLVEYNYLDDYNKLISKVKNPSVN